MYSTAFTASGSPDCNIGFHQKPRITCNISNHSWQVECGWRIWTYLYFRTLVHNSFCSYFKPLEWLQINPNKNNLSDSSGCLFSRSTWEYSAQDVVFIIYPGFLNAFPVRVWSSRPLSAQQTGRSWRCIEWQFVSAEYHTLLVALMALSRLLGLAMSCLTMKGLKINIFKKFIKVKRTFEILNDVKCVLLSSLGYS